MDSSLTIVDGWRSTLWVMTAPTECTTPWGFLFALRCLSADRMGWQFHFAQNLGRQAEWSAGQHSLRSSDKGLFPR